MKKLLLPVLYIFSSYVFSQSTPPPPPVDGEGYIFPGGVAPEAIPTINAEMEVNGSGALVYTVPIEVFPGINNFQPNLALSYNSQSGNGQAGWGWNIIGLSVITQGGTSKEIEGITRGPQFTDSDPLYLDGQRLIKTGTNTYETRLYSKVQILKGTDGNYSFIVKYPDGKIGKYKQLGYGQYYISTIVDALGTEIHYEYQVANNVPYVKSISYGGISVSTDTYKIEFVFKNRAYPIKTYRNGMEFLNNKVLSQLIVSSTYDGIHRKYLLTHDKTSSGYERLKTVEIENKQGDKLKPLNFSYPASASQDPSGSVLAQKKETFNKGLVNTKVKSLGNVVTSDFRGTGKPYPVYNMQTDSGYKILDSNTGMNLSLPSDNDTQLFAGKTLFSDNNSITANEQLITINTEFTGDELENGYYTPKIKVKITVTNLPTGKTKEVFFSTKGHYQRGWDENDRECPRPSGSGNIIDCASYSRSKDLGKVIVSDFNNDGLTDMLIWGEVSSCNVQAGGRPYRIPGLKVESKKSVPYFIEIGKLLQSGEIIPEIFEAEGGILGAPVELNGDGIPELLGNPTGIPNSSQTSSGGGTRGDTSQPSQPESEPVIPTKTAINVDVQNKLLKAMKMEITMVGTIIPPSRGNRDSDATVFWGDFNGDGLMDYITPNTIYSLYDNIMSNGKENPTTIQPPVVSAQEVMNKINSEKLTWNLYINTGTGFKQTQLDMTSQKLAYIAPSQKNVIKESSDWEKFWSGKEGKYQYTEYGTSYIIPMDFDNDGKTDLVSIRKFTRLKQDNDYLDNLGIDNLLLSTPNANVITFHKAVTDENGNTSFVQVKAGNSSTIDIGNIKISPLSLLINTSDYNQLDTYQAGIIIHDPITRKDIQFTLDNSEFMETRLNEVDNGSGVIQTIEYRPMVSTSSTNSEKIYSVSGSTLPYPYYIHEKQGTLYLAHKLNTLFDGKAITKEYRYEDGVQQLQGKGFLGFRRTFISDPYESELKNGSYYKKDIFGSPVFWKTNTFDPDFDNSLVRTTYGSADSNTVFTESTIAYQKYDKGNFRYLILSTTEKRKDYLKKVNSQKTYTYDPTTLYLKESYTSVEDGFSTSNQETYSYKPDFTNGEHNFSGKIEKTETTQSRNGATFSTKEEYTYNNNGQVTQSKKYGNNTDAVTTSYTYDNYGNALTETVFAPGLSSLTTKYEYDATHRYSVKITSPEGLSATKNINTLGQVLSETSALGLTTSYIYDNWNNLKETTDYLGHKSTLEKIALDNGKYQLTTQTAGQAPAIAVFDKFDRKIQTRTLVMGKWLYTDIQYDLFGKVLKTSEPYYEGETPLWNTTEYDYLNRPVKQTLYTGKVVTTCYEGLKVTVQDGHQKISRTLDASGHTIEHNDSGGKIKYTYYPNGALKEANYDGIAIKNEQDGWGNKTKTIDPSAGTYEYSYDNYGRMFKETTPKGYTTITYDSYGKVLNEVSEGDGVSISKVYTYDPTTKLPTKISGYSDGKNFTYETYYDQYYRIKGKKETTPYLVSESGTTFDSYGRPEVATLKTTIVETGYITSSKVRNEYNYWGELVRQWDADTNTLIQELQGINSHEQVTQMKYGNGYTLTNTYNNLFYLQNISHKNGNLTAVNIDYDYDAIKGTLKSRNNKNFNKNESFEYDELDRLLKERVNGILQNEYTYDKRGRMTYNSNVGTYQYTNNNYQLNQIAFNNPGTQLNQNRGFHEVTYNAFKSPTEIYLAGKDRISFEYGILKNRSVMYYGNTDTNISSKPNRRYYTSDGSVEVTKTGNSYKVVTYINGDGYSASYIKIEQLNGSTLSSSKKYFLHRDNLGSLIALTDAQSGAIAEQRYFDAWGNLAEVKDATNKLLTSNFTLLIDRGYTGHEHLLSVGLINMNARLYDPALRRFLSPDNFVQDPYNTQNYNRYGYVLNNPLLYTDPSGELIPQIIIGVVIAIATNGIMNQINGVPAWYGMGKAATVGAVSAAISLGIGAVASSLSSSMSAVATAAIQAGMHGVTGGVMSSIDGGNFWSGFAAGAVSSIISSGIEGLGTDSSGNLNKFGKSSGFKATMIAAGGLSGGISSSIAGGNFWDGMRQGLITSGLNHGVHWATNSFFGLGDPPDKKTSAHVYIETDGVGHVYIEVDGVVYSYGRYNGSYSPSSGSLGPLGDGVLLRLEGKDAVTFIEERIAKYPTSKFSVEVNGSKVKDYYNKRYDSGQPLENKTGYNKYGRVIGIYNLAGPGGDNCTTITYKALNYGGANIPAAQTPVGMRYDFTQQEYYKQGYDPSRRISGPK